jgi:hypothetical protein
MAVAMMQTWVSMPHTITVSTPESDLSCD